MFLVQFAVITFAPLAGSNPGAALRMLNMEISQFGGYRRVSGYTAYDSSYGSVSGVGQVLGIWILGGVPYAIRRNDGDFTGSLGANPFTTSSGSSTITVAHTSHGLAVDDRVIFSGSSGLPTTMVTPSFSKKNSGTEPKKLPMALRKGVSSGEAPETLILETVQFVVVG